MAIKQHIITYLFMAIRFFLIHKIDFPSVQIISQYQNIQYFSYC